jgi:hypothetical protein
MSRRKTGSGSHKGTKPQRQDRRMPRLPYFVVFVAPCENELPCRRGRADTGSRRQGAGIGERRRACKTKPISRGQGRRRRGRSSPAAAGPRVQNKANWGAGPEAGGDAHPTKKSKANSGPGGQRLQIADLALWIGGGCRAKQSQFGWGRRHQAAGSRHRGEMPAVQNKANFTRTGTKAPKEEQTGRGWAAVRKTKPIPAQRRRRAGMPALRRTKPIGGTWPVAGAAWFRFASRMPAIRARRHSNVPSFRHSIVPRLHYSVVAGGRGA